MYFHENEKEEEVVVHRGMGTIIALSSIAIILIGLFPSGLMSIALESIPF
jgi:NADH:ubiquinone oxidoreductase subunit 2 (subunit N)